jgi:hypothetical protein
MLPAGFEHTIPASVRPQTHASDRAATGQYTASLNLQQNITDYNWRVSKRHGREMCNFFECILPRQKTS